MKVSANLVCWVLLEVAGRVVGGNLRSNLDVPTNHSISERDLSRARRGLNDPTDALRNFVGTAVLKVPDLEATQQTWLGPLYLRVSNFRCFDISYSDININMVSGTADQVQLEVTDLLFKCDLGISWAYRRLDGSGTAHVSSDRNYLSTVMATGSSATGESNQDCQETVIDIDTLEFSGDMSLRVLNLYRVFIKRVAEAKIEEIFCDLVSQELLGFLLSVAEGKVEEFSRELPPWRTDPLFIEQTAIVPTDGSIVNLQNDPQMNGLMDLAIHNLNSIYSTRKYDSTAQTQNQMDYGINAILREKFLQDRVFTYYRNTDKTSGRSTSLVDIELTIMSIEIHGLDTAAVVSPLTVVGSCTIQHRLKWDSLLFEGTMTVKVSASNSSGSFFENADQIEPILETFQVVQTVKDLEVLSSFYVPLDREEVEVLPMGYILNWESLPGCIPPVLSGMQISGLDLTIGNIEDPVLQGIESRDFDELLSKSVQIGLASFGDGIASVIPQFIQTDIRDALDRKLVNNRCSDVGRRLSEEGEEEFVRPQGQELYFNMFCAFVCVCTAAMAAGLTMGLLSLDELMLLIKERAGATEKERKAAARLLPIVRKHHLLLVSLLLMNAMANEALPLFLDKIVPGYIAVILSVTVSYEELKCYVRHPVNQRN